MTVGWGAGQGGMAAQAPEEVQQTEHRAGQGRVGMVAVHICEYSGPETIITMRQAEEEQRASSGVHRVPQGRGAGGQT